MLKHWLIAIRPKTLSASIAPILLSQVLAWHYASSFSWFLALTIFACALLLQISVNLANDYFDDKAGIDTAQRLGPARAIQTGLLTQQQVKRGMIVSLLSACIIGLGLIIHGGFFYLILGLLSVAGVLAYSAGPKPLASHALGEIAVFVFFGPIAVMGGFYLQVKGGIETSALPELLSYSAQMGLLAAAIMLVNNIRDIPTDSIAGKHTLAIALGSSASKILYIFFAIAVIALALWNLQSLWQVALGLVATTFLSITIFKRQGAALNQQLAQTSGFMLVWSLLCAVDFLYSI